MKILLTIISILLTAIRPAHTLEIEGVAIPPSLELQSHSLTLNGAGLRTFSLLMVPIKIYVAAFYSPSPLRSEKAVAASPGPLAFTFTFLRSVGKADVAKAWRSQFQASNSHIYSGLQKDIDCFISMFGALDSGGVQMVQFTNTDTRIFDQGTLKGSIPGRDFQLSFLSLWFGKNAVSLDLKKALLGQ